LVCAKQLSRDNLQYRVDRVDGGPHGLLIVSIKKARAALSHSVFTDISRNHLDRLVAELAEPFAAAGEGRLYGRRGGRRRRRWPGAGHPKP
jgi:hypothetical protein